MSENSSDAPRSSAVNGDFEAAKPEETLPLLQSAIGRKARLQCWSPGRKHSYTSRIVKVNDVAGKVSISVSKEFPGGTEFESALLREGHEEVLFSLHLPTDVVFFKADFRKEDSGFFGAKVKLPIYKVQRRGSMRLPIQGKATILISDRDGGNENLKVDLVNISDGGIGVVLTDKAVFDRLMGLKLPVTLTLEVNHIRVSCQALARHGFEVSSSLVRKSYRLGFEFQGLDEKVKTQISQMVFEESAKFLGRF